MNLFSRKNIDSRPFFYPVSSMPTFEKFVNKKTIKKRIQYLTIYLPMGSASQVPQI